MRGPFAFTATFSGGGQPNVLLSGCEIKPVGTAGELRSFQAIWDTGATHSAITQEVVDQCGLKPIGKRKIYHAGVSDQPDESDVYLVNVGLPNRVMLEQIEVTRGGFRGADVLIGMDIIKAGDFAITHANGQSKFTFQIPAQADVDFTKGQPTPPPRNREERRTRQYSKRPRPRSRL